MSGNANQSSHAGGTVMVILGAMFMGTTSVALGAAFLAIGAALIAKQKREGIGDAG